MTGYGDMDWKDFLRILNEKIGNVKYEGSVKEMNCSNKKQINVDFLSIILRLYKK